MHIISTDMSDGPQSTLRRNLSKTNAWLILFVGPIGICFAESWVRAVLHGACSSMPVESASAHGVYVSRKTALAMAVNGSVMRLSPCTKGYAEGKEYKLSGFP